MYRLSRLLSLADIARQCGCKIVSSGKSHNVARATVLRANRVDT